MKPRRIVTPVSGALALALGIALFYRFAGPGVGEPPPRAENADPAIAAETRKPVAQPPAASAPEDEWTLWADDAYVEDDLPDPYLGDRAVSDRSFGEIVKFVVRERCDDDGNCRPGPVALHEYEDYSIEELKAIAKFDGEAAIVLASKIGGKDFKEAREWALRAFVMTKDPYAYHMAANFSGVSRGEGIDANGKLDRKTAERAYVWLKTAYLLGVNDGAYLTEQEIILDRHGVTDRARLDRQVNASIEYLMQKRLELTGEGF
ncbi:MAG: hypothetical protein KJP08_04360 [Gammaproteobacteria bacterium]|nr:hypothetical protein [Gammaproteobacteria bacterium]NNF50631.1 hypothetical protein [Woeseiaceae bacterium]MBT8094020.1 hypothetical protein [Gammaproteobacteria bacterium]MBT8105679.1 hypothetical protein [Gammaproteobacteria bacterium]NNK25693.1 hypothetical protein [Woeseiaceae bacterium]